MHCYLRPPEVMRHQYQVKIFLGIRICVADKGKPSHLDSLWDATLMPLRSCAMDWGRNRILSVGKMLG